MMTKTKSHVASRCRIAGLLLLFSQAVSCAGPAVPAKPPGSSNPAPTTHAGKRERGIASVYTDHRTASGERFSSRALTAAHRTLPFGSRVNVTAPRTGRSVIVRINDRGPFVRGRIIDLTPAAASALGLTKSMGVTTVEIACLP